MQEHTYTWHQVPTIPQTGIDACVGKVNDGVFDTIRVGVFTGFARGTLLCMAPQVSPLQRSVTGQETYTITYKFLYQTHGHNSFPRQQANTIIYETATIGGAAGAGRLYAEVDFNLLFRLPI